MIKLKYIILPLTLLVLAGCSDKTNEPNGEEITIVVPATNTPSSTDEGTTEDPAKDPTEDPKNTRSRVVEEDDNETDVIVEETIPSNWYIRIIAEDQNRSLKTNLSQLGELEETNAVQDHTLVSGGRWSNPYLDVIFIDPDGMPTGDYKTNYHVYSEGINDSWSFNVETNDANAEIRLSWSGLYILTPTVDAQNRTQYTEYRSSTNPLIAKMKLIDSTTGTEIPAILNNEVQVYIFNMNGQVTRSFEWVVQYD